MTTIQPIEGFPLEYIKNGDVERHKILNDPKRWMELPLDEIVPRSVKFSDIRALVTFCLNAENNPVDKIMALDYYYHRSVLLSRSDAHIYDTLIDRIVTDFYYAAGGEHPIIRDTLDIYHAFADVDQSVLDNYVKEYLVKVTKTSGFNITELLRD